MKNPITNLSRKVTLLLIAVATAIVCQAQSDYTHYLIKELSTPKYHGRSFVKNGSNKAAAFLRKEFKKAGLKEFDGDYYQRFNLDVNTFPGKMEVAIDGKPLQAAEHFVMREFCEGKKGVFKVLIVDEKILKERTLAKKLKNNDNIQKFFIAYNASLMGDYKQALIELLKLNIGGEIRLMPKKQLRRYLGGNQTLRTRTSIWMDEQLMTGKDKATLTLDFDNKFIKGYEVKNVAGMLEGTKYPDSLVIIGGHYDHNGYMGKKYIYPGANDNASAIAMTLEMARYFEKPENRPEFSLVFAAFGSEENGLLGAKHFVNTLPMDKSKIKGMINMDMLQGVGGKFYVYNGKEEPRITSVIRNTYNKKDRGFELVVKENLPESDHAPFVDAGIPAVFFSTFSFITHPNFHTPKDTYEAFKFDYWNDIEEIVKETIKNI